MIFSFVDAHARALDTLIEKYGLHVTFIPHYISGFPGDDVEISKSILEKMQHKDQANIIETDSVSEFKILLDQMDMLVTSKMHPAILAVTGYVPVLSVVYDHKQTGFFQRLDMLDNTIDIHDVSYISLLSKMEQTWVEREKLKESLRQQIPKWQNKLRSVFNEVVTPYIN